MKKLLFTCIISVIFFSCTQIKPDKEKERVDAVCDNFMQAFKNAKSSEAIKLLKR